MRLWSLHPSLLDRQGLVALWREALLAQAVLAGRTRGYRNHPQLARFRQCPEPLGAVAAYLDAVADEADHRGYRFERSRIDDVVRTGSTIAVTSGQRDYEMTHLRAKLAARNPERLEYLPDGPPPLHPAFHLVEGPIASWERTG